MGPEADTEAAPPPRPRALANAFIALFLLVQVAVPLTYYLGERVEDERFGWRMFSTVRLRRCDVRVSETVAGTSRPVPLTSELHIAWINLIKRGRTAVVHEFLAHRCVESGADEVLVDRRCIDTDGTTLPPDPTAIACATGELRADP